MHLNQLKNCLLSIKTKQYRSVLSKSQQWSFRTMKKSFWRKQEQELLLKSGRLRMKKMGVTFQEEVDLGLLRGSKS